MFVAMLSIIPCAFLKLDLTFVLSFGFIVAEFELVISDFLIVKIRCIGTLVGFQRLCEYCC